MLPRFRATLFHGFTLRVVACAVLMGVVPVSRAEHGDPHLIAIPQSGERLDPDGTVVLLAENGPEITVVGACSFRFVAGDTVTWAVTVRTGRSVDSDGYGSSFRVVRAIRRLSPNERYRLEARCGDEQRFTALPLDVPDGVQPGTFVVDERAAEPPVITAIEIGESPWHNRMVSVQMSGAEPALLLIETLGARSRVASVAAWAGLHHVLIQGSVRRIRITPLSRGFRRGVARTVVMPRASATQGQSFYVEVRDMVVVPP